MHSLRMVSRAPGAVDRPEWKEVPSASEGHTQDTEELFSVEATLVVTDSSVGNVTCSVLNPILGQEKAMAIFIPGQCCFSLPAELSGRS